MLITLFVGVFFCLRTGNGLSLATYFNLKDKTTAGQTPITKPYKYLNNAIFLEHLNLLGTQSDFVWAV